MQRGQAAREGAGHGNQCTARSHAKGSSCQSIEKDTKAEAVQSDGDNLDIAKEEEMEEEEDGDGGMEEEILVQRLYRRCCYPTS